MTKEDKKTIYCAWFGELHYRRKWVPAKIIRDDEGVGLLLFRLKKKIRPWAAPVTKAMQFRPPLPTFLRRELEGTYRPGRNYLNRC